jgi:cytochrome c-type biogenesis protein
VNDLINLLNRSFYEMSLFALLASTLWGMLSVFLSPCHIGSLPLIIGYINNHKMPGRREGFKLSLLFSMGILLMLIFVGTITGLLGKILGEIGAPTTIIVSVFLIICGLWLMEIPIFNKIQAPLPKGISRSKNIGAFSLGFVYGIILGPCSFAFLAPMLGIVFSKSSGQFGFGIILILFYGIGHTLAIVGAGTFGDLIIDFIQKKGFYKFSLWIKRILGGFVMLYGIWKIIDCVSSNPFGLL